MYALGAVLYEMLTGDPPFTGSTAQAVVARVVTESPRPLVPQRHTIPAHVEAAVLTALEKLPADRFASAAQFAEALTRPGAATSSATAAVAGPGGGAHRRTGARFSGFVVPAVATVAGAALALGAARLFQSPAPPPLRPVRFVYTGTDTARVVPSLPWPAAISPDGSTLVYAVAVAGGDLALYSRRMDQLEPHLIPGTINAYQPLFSPDGQWLAFQADNKERKVRLDGSAPVTIAEGASANGVAWTTSDVLVRGSTGSVHGLAHVSVAGGEPTQLTVPDTAKGELDHLWPVAVSDGRSIVFTVWFGALASARLAITSLDDGTVTDLGLKGVRPLAVVDGALLYVQVDGAVMAVRLNARRRRVEGKPIPVLDPVTVIAANNGNSGIYISQGGALLTGHENSRAHLAWVERDGAMERIGREIRNFVQPRLSPDGRRLAMLIYDGSKSDVWIYDLATGTLSRLTTLENVTSVEWSGDGREVIYSAGGFESRAGIWSQAVDAASAPERLLELSHLTPLVSMSPDRHWLALPSLYESWDVMRVALDSPRTVQPFSCYTGAGGHAADLEGRPLGRARERRVGHLRGVRQVVSGADGQAAGVCRRGRVATVVGRRSQSVLRHRKCDRPGAAGGRAGAESAVPRHGFRAGPECRRAVRRRQFQRDSRRLTNRDTDCRVGRLPAGGGSELDHRVPRADGGEPEVSRYPAFDTVAT